VLRAPEFTEHDLREFLGAIARATAGDMERHERRLESCLRLDGLTREQLVQVRGALRERRRQLDGSRIEPDLKRSQHTLEGRT
jgi:hypothetical protein